MLYDKMEYAYKYLTFTFIFVFNKQIKDFLDSKEADRINIIDFMCLHIKSTGRVTYTDFEGYFACF
jgi:hypothetical protein